jgi:hypothetical protein
MHESVPACMCAECAQGTLEDYSMRHSFLIIAALENYEFSIPRQSYSVTLTLHLEMQNFAC